ncbi:hypothetical protein CSR02_01360 [Acetobacter pomorum]|uniref:Hedgehog/Intein (Hint) domain-containing protein n=1 Tax=Acetobacter pomorum TaxID=65959 RepID=A0A2G4RFN0_9PROT|nr:Hint domain-containing protein [Acetobacter pomorum]PHY95348.1 hypothetical protein CSR02_01360 [Acetobacter pomorum]
MASTQTINWSDVPQSGGTVGSAQTTTTVTGTPSSALNDITFSGIVILDNNGSVELQQTTISSGSEIVVKTGTNLTFNTSTLPSGTIEIDGGSLTNTNAYSSSGPLVIAFGATTSSKNNTVTLNAYGLSNTTFTNVSPGDNITFVNSWGNVTLVDDGSGIIDVKDSSGKTLTTLHTAKNADGTYYKASDFTASADGNNSVLVCFLAGSMIQTSEGDVAVEDIQIGDEIIAFDWRNDEDVVRQVVWVGKARATVRPDLPDDEAGWPVRILKGAIADGVPYKDMLITSEHCLFFRDRFVPVRMLVNGVSIFYDKSITSYDYYHVETEQHSVITADGMLTESYLDTGNRSSFRQEGKIATLRGAVKNWADDAGAPLGVERSFVEPLFRTLEWRENSVVGTKISTTKIETTTDPDLHLITQTGAVIRPMRKTAHHYSFMLPPNTESVQIVSRSSRPSDVIGPFVNDRRYMGVAVADVQLQCAKQQFDITSHLQDEKPSGWHDTDWTDCAWTNGNAELPLGDHLTHGKMGILSMTIRAAGPYLLNTKPNSDMKKRSA